VIADAHARGGYSIPPHSASPNQVGAVALVPGPKISGVQSAVMAHRGNSTGEHMTNTGIVTIIAFVALAFGAWWIIGRRLGLLTLKKDGIEIDATGVESKAVPDRLLWEVAAESEPAGSCNRLVIKDYIFGTPMESGPRVGSSIRIIYSPTTPEPARIANSAM